VVFLLGLTSAHAGTECAPDKIDIRSDNSTVRFSTEVVDSPESRALGLMNRESLGMFAGMLFVYPNPQPMRFWMRNTLIPLMRRAWCSLSTKMRSRWMKRQYLAVTTFNTSSRSMAGWQEPLK
jgi:hypothetical protein